MSIKYTNIFYYKAFQWNFWYENLASIWQPWLRMVAGRIANPHQAVMPILAKRLNSEI
jgi:hypothetical protein